MARELTTALSNATLAQTVAPILLVEILLDSAPIRMWAGIGTLRWNNVDWIGTGGLLGISEITETQEVRATGCDISLSGIPQDLISLALTENYSARPARVYLGALNLTTGAVIADPYRAFSGLCDTMEIEDGGETSTIKLSVESKLIDLERPRERRYEDADQRLTDSTDEFFKFVSGIQDVEVVWGRSA